MSIQEAMIWFCGLLLVAGLAVGGLTTGQTWIFIIGLVVLMGLVVGMRKWNG